MHKYTGDAITHMHLSERPNKQYVEPSDVKIGEIVGRHMGLRINTSQQFLYVFPF